MPWPIYGQPPATPPVPPTPGTLGAIEWHRADAVSFSSGALIDTWTDLSPSGYTKVLSGGNVNARATQLPTSAPNGQPSASCPNPFAGNTTGYHTLGVGYNSQTAGGALSMMVVAKPDATINDNLIYRYVYCNAGSTPSTNDGDGFYWSPFDLEPWRANVFDAGLAQGGQEATSAPGDWQFLLFCIDWGVGDVSMYQLGGLFDAATVANTATRAALNSFLLRFSAGNAAYTSFSSWFGEVAEVALFPSSLKSDGTVDLLNAYVGDRYGPTMVANAGSARSARRSELAAQAARDAARRRRPDPWTRRGRIYVPASLGSLASPGPGVLGCSL